MPEELGGCAPDAIIPQTNGLKLNAPRNPQLVGGSTDAGAELTNIPRNIPVRLTPAKSFADRLIVSAFMQDAQCPRHQVTAHHRNQTRNVNMLSSHRDIKLRQIGAAANPARNHNIRREPRDVERLEEINREVARCVTYPADFLTAKGIRLEHAVFSDDARV